MDNNIDTILFDFGGTLDTNGIHWSELLWNQYVKENVAVTKEQFYESYVYAEKKLGSENIIEATDTMYDVLKKKIDIETQYLVNQGWLHTEEITRRSYLEHITVRSYYLVKQNIARVGDMLRSLAMSHKLILVSNFYGNLTTVLEDLGILDIFTDVVDSAIVNVRKPDSQIYNLAIHRNDIKPNNAVIVGDSMKNDIIPAQQLGIQSIWLNPNYANIHHGCTSTLQITDILQLPQLLA